MIKFGEIERIVVQESNSLLASSCFNPPFPVILPANGTVNLATVTIGSGCSCNGVVLDATINWSATFTPTAVTTLDVPGFADVTFELLRNGIAIYRVRQTAVQGGFPLVQPEFQFATPVATFKIATLLYFDFAPVLCNGASDLAEFNTYTLTATAINLVDPQVATPSATTTAAVGAVTLLAAKVEACIKSCIK